MNTSTTERKRWRIRVSSHNNTSLILDQTAPDNEEMRQRCGSTAREVAQSVAADFCDAGSVMVVDLKTNEHHTIARRHV